MYSDRRLQEKTNPDSVFSPGLWKAKMHLHEVSLQVCLIQHSNLSARTTQKAIYSLKFTALTVQDLWTAQYSYRSRHNITSHEGWRRHLNQDIGVSQESAHSTELSSSTITAAISIYKVLPISTQTNCVIDQEEARKLDLKSQ